MRRNVRTRATTVVTLAIGLLLATALVAHAAMSPEQKCQKGRKDASAKYLQCHEKAMGQHLVSNDLAKLQPALSKCRMSFAASWLKLQKKAVGTGATCDAPRFVDNGDGTVTDNLTGLDWEKKTDNATANDKDNAYIWSAAYSIFLSGDINPPGLNEEQPAAMGPFTVPCFGTTPCSWRLPTIAELQTLLSEPFPCTTSPCIHPIFGATIVNDDYWSATTLANDASRAWGVFFLTGEVSYGPKNATTNSVRAVRGGL